MEIALGLLVLAGGICLYAKLGKGEAPQVPPRSPPTRPGNWQPQRDAVMPDSVGPDLVVTISFSTQIVEGHDDGDDLEYAAFVAGIWASADIYTQPVPLMLNGQPAILHSLKRRDEPAPFVNVFLGQSRARKTFVANRHSWSHAGQPVEPVAFTAMLHGVPAEKAVLPDPAPTTLAEAILNNRCEAKGRSVALHFRDRHGVESWRIISGLQRGDEKLNARCHYRWGERRSFRNANILALVDPDTRAPIDVAAYLARRIDLPRRQASKGKAK